jgi:hypothetical protein
VGLSYLKKKKLRGLNSTSPQIAAMGSSSKRKKEKQKDFQVSQIYILKLISHFGKTILTVTP